MKTKSLLLSCVALAIIVLCLKLTHAEVQRPFFKQTDCGDFCSRVRCAQQKQEECKDAEEVFVPRDGDCYCCDSCITRTKAQTPAANLDKKCKPDHCAGIECYDVPAKQCFDKGLAFISKDECSCCDHCA